MVCKERAGVMWGRKPWENILFFIVVPVQKSLLSYSNDAIIADFAPHH